MCFWMEDIHQNANLYKLLRSKKTMRITFSIEAILIVGFPVYTSEQNKLFIKYYNSQRECNWSQNKDFVLLLVSLLIFAFVWSQTGGEEISFCFLVYIFDDADAAPLKPSEFSWKSQVFGVEARKQTSQNVFALGIWVMKIRGSLFANKMYFVWFWPTWKQL